jgi:hypothetical protein
MPDQPVRRRVCSSCHQMGSRTVGASMLRPGKGSDTGRCLARFETASSRRTARQIDQAAHTKAFGDFAQLRAGGGKETAVQRTPAELLHSVLPALSATAEPLEDPGQFRSDRGLSLAKKSTLRSLCFLLFKVGLHRVGSVSRFRQRA